MPNKLRFFVEFLRKPNRVGAVAPSSRSLAELIVDTAGVESADAIVEFGAGGGIFTETIEKARPAGSLFFAIEICLLSVISSTYCPRGCLSADFTKML